MSALQPERVTVENEGRTLSNIVWRRFRKPMPGLVERILDANPGLAEVGLILPVGTSFLMPIDREEPDTAADDRLISLWS